MQTIYILHTGDSRILDLNDTRCAVYRERDKSESVCVRVICVSSRFAICMQFSSPSQCIRNEMKWNAWKKIMKWKSNGLSSTRAHMSLQRHGVVNDIRFIYIDPPRDYNQQTFFFYLNINKQLNSTENANRNGNNCEQT